MAHYEDYTKNYETATEREICINLYHMEACSGNLKKVLSQWNEKKCKLAKDSTVSQGYMANAIFGEGENGIGFLDLLDEISENTTTLLNNSITFFENLGKTFEEVDVKIAKGLKE